MNRQQNRSRNRDNYSNNNRNRSRNQGNDYRRRDDYDRSSNRYQGGGGRRVDHGSQMSQNRDPYNVNASAYSQNMGMYAQNQMAGYGAYGASTAFQQNRFSVGQQQMINPWANNMIPTGSSVGGGEEAKLAMNILNAVLSSSTGASPSGRGMSPPPSKMRRMDYRDGGYDDRRRRPRSPPGRSQQNRQQSSQRFGSDRRGRDGRSSYQRNDDHRFRNSFNKSPGGSRSSRQSSTESNEYVFRKRLSFEEREREHKKFEGLSLKALRCRMCEKSTFFSVAAYLAHVDSKGHSKVAKAYHEKIAATISLMKHNAKLALHKEKMKAKASGKKVSEKECRVCEAPMVYGNLKHKNILACKILHKYQKQTLCCGKDHKNRFLTEEHCLSLAHLKVKYELQGPKDDEKTDANKNEEENKNEDENKNGSVKETVEDEKETVEDEEEKIKRLKRDEARRKRKYGEVDTDEEEDDDDDENHDDTLDEDKEQEEEEEEENKNEEQKDSSNKDKENGEEHNEQEQMECNEQENDDGNKDESMETNEDQEIKDSTEKENGVNDKTEKDDDKAKENKESDKKETKDKNEERKNDNKNKNKNDKDDLYQGQQLTRMTMEELVKFHKKSVVEDPENLGIYDPAYPTGINYIETHVAFQCMACIEYYPASADELKGHCLSKEHYDLFRSKYMKLQGVRDTPMGWKKQKKDKDSESKGGDKQTDKKEGRTKREREETDKPGTETEEAGGDDALYDPYEGESGDLTTMLQDKESAEQEDSEVPEGYEVQDEVHESEPENYEDNILDYEDEDGVLDEDKDENKERQRNKKAKVDDEEAQDEENEEVDENENEEVDDNENEEVDDDENEEVEYDGNEEVDDGNEEVDDGNEYYDDGNEEGYEDGNEEVDDDGNEEVDDGNEEVEDENEEVEDENEEVENEEAEEEEQENEEVEEEEEVAPPPVSSRRGKVKRR